MFRKFFILSTVLMISTLSQADENVRFGRYPAPSPDGQTLVFTYQGDLWQVSINGGRAQRLTVHEAYDRYAVWSPDGNEIAFSSDRFGNDDIYIIPAEGGRPERMTHFSSGDRMCDWLDKETLLFTSRRDFYYNRQPLMYKLSRVGGTPKKLAALYANEGAVSPDGHWFAFVRGRYGWDRKHYRGSSNTDIWLFNLQTEEITRLTIHEGNDRCPRWAPDSKTLYYLTDEDGIFNIWSMNIESMNKRQITFHKDDGVRFPAVSDNGNIIAYEHAFDLWTVHPDTRDTKKLTITAPTDDKANLVEWKTFSGDASEMVVSPDEEEIAFVVRGEVFVMKNKEKAPPAKRITQTSSRERDIAWAPGGDTLIFVSDQYGQRDLFMVTPADTSQGKLHEALKTTTTRLTDSDEEEYAPQFSPDGKKLVYIQGLGDIMIRDMKNGRTTRLIEGWNQPEIAWSPDGKWIAFSRDDAEFNADIWIIPSTGGEAVNVTQHPDADFNPVWSQDGRKLGFVSRRIGNNVDVWFVYLRQADEEKTKEELEDEKAAKKDKKNKDEKKSVDVKIDFKNIYRRLHRVTSLGSRETSLTISPDAETFAFVADIRGKQDLWTVNWDGTELKQLTKNGQRPQDVQWSKDGKTINYRSRGKIRKIAPSGKDGKVLAHSARMDIDYRSERVQKFDEGWRTLNRRFYDPEFHGVDWQAMKDKYRPIAAEQATTTGFNDVVSLMLGELNASHLGIRGPNSGPRITTGMLGLRFDETYDGTGMRVESVMPDGPCDKENARVEPGEILLSIEGQTIDPRTNIHEILNEKVDQRVIIEVAPKNRKTRRSIVVRPVSPNAFNNLEYDRWVETKRAKVEEWSEGRVAYAHIRSMNMPSFERFEMELYAVAHEKDALIIDVRNNGGGSTTDYMLTILAPKLHAYTIPRDGDKGYPISERLPYYAWTKPMVAMCNEWSFSNAEIFPHAIKTIGRGKVVGSPTGGLVISTGSIRLIDGATFRVPFRGWWTMSTGLNQENNGCVPDVVIWEQPGDAAKEVDRQLQKAVEVLMEELK